MPLRVLLRLWSPPRWVPLVLLPLALGGCGTLGLGGSPTPSPSPSPGAASGPGWVVVTKGSPTPSAALPRGTASPSPALPPVSFLPVDRSCTPGWDLAAVQIPLTVTPGAGKLTVSWPRQWDSGYRIAAVPQPLVSGYQPTPAWQTVPPGTGCTVTATISGLTSGKPYIVWLDAPGTGAERDGSRHPYSGSSGVVYPQ